MTVAIGSPQNDGNGSNSGNVRIFSFDECLGCTDSAANNYDLTATQDNGSCQYCDISAIVIESEPTSSTSCDRYIFANISSSYSIISTQISDFNTGQIFSNNNGAFGLCSNVYTFEVVDNENCVYTRDYFTWKYLWMH